MENRVTGVVSPESVLKIMEAFKVIEDELPFLIELSPAESKRTVRMEARRFPFVKKALMLAGINDQLKPPFLKLEEMEKDLDLCRVLDEVMFSGNSLVKKIADTRNQAGHEAYNGAREIYQIAKRGYARGIEGAEVAYDELKLLFDGQGKTAKPDSTVD